MKSKGVLVTTGILLVVAVVCTGICGWQTAVLLGHRAVFAVDHPDYIPHSWYLLAVAAAVAVLAWTQLSQGKKIKPMPLGAVSALMAVLAVLEIRAAMDQHYHLGMLISDYGISVPLPGSWLLLGLTALLVPGIAVQLLLLLFSVWRKPEEPGGTP